MRTPLTLDTSRPRRYLDEFSISKIVRPLDEVVGTPELRYARNGRGERFLCMRWPAGAATRADLEVFWLDELRHLNQLVRTDDEGLFARVVAARADDEGFHLVLARKGRYVLAELLQRYRWPCESPSDRAHTWRNLGRLAAALGVLHEHGIVHGRVNAWSVLASKERTDHFQLTGFEWAMRAPSSARQTAIEHLFVHDWRDLAALARSLLGAGRPTVELTQAEQTFLHDLERTVYLEGARVRRRALNIAAALDSAQDETSGTRRVNRDDGQALALRGLLLAQVIQAVLQTASEFPVEVVATTLRHQSAGNRRWQVRLRARSNKQYTALCNALEIRQPLSRRLFEALTETDSPLSDAWYWVGNENAEGNEAELSFVKVHASSERHYIFNSDVELPKLGRGFLINSRGGRGDQQFRRQLRAWQGLRRRPALLDHLINPSSRGAAVPTSAVVEDESFLDLDQDKQRALRKVLAEERLALTHGPPGVGKTTLVAAVVRQMRQTGRCGKILFSAQSHGAVDHLLSAVREATSGEVFIVRCQAPETKRAPSPEDLPRQVDATLRALKQSVGLAEASDLLRVTVGSLIEGNTRSTHAKAMRLHRRPLESHLLRAAPLVFGTSNCAAFEHLVNERVLFDLSIIEEAAKASGNDLLNTLLLARRQLLVGDHRQLPPFDSEKVERLLASPSQLALILSSLPESIARLFEHELELRNLQRLFAHAQADSRRIRELCQSGLRMLFLFKTLITAPDAASESGYASALTVQHRMHPAIAQIVSHAFYNDTLRSDPKCIARFTSSPPPVRFKGDAYAETPILWIDMPWVQNAFGRGHGEQKPGPVNMSEVRVVTEVVHALKPNGDGDRRPSLAILTPYRRQLVRLQSTLMRSASSSLERFAPIGGAYFHTVDSFQGNEADIIIVSLVRNNGQHSLRRALGFLQDERRMTVLMSRAKWRLIVVGSLDFLRSALERHQEPRTNNIQFLARLLESLEEAHKQSNASIVRPVRRGSRR